VHPFVRVLQCVAVCCSVLQCVAVYPFVSGWFVISLYVHTACMYVCVYKLLVTVPYMTFAYVFDAGLFRVRKYESVVIGFRHQGGSCL